MVALQTVLVILAAAEPRAEHGAGAPLSEIKRSTEALRKVLSKHYPSWSPEAEARTAMVARIIDSVTDFEEIARRTLGPRWDDLSDEQRADFSTTLQRLIEQRSLDLRRLGGDTPISFDGETVDGDEATVATTVTVARQGGELRRHVVYRLVHKQGRWRMFDVVVDGTSMVENYRAQFARIIASESMEGLLRRMRKKLLAEVH